METDPVLYYEVATKTRLALPSDMRHVSLCNLSHCIDESVPYPKLVEVPYRIKKTVYESGREEVKAVCATCEKMLALVNHASVCGPCTGQETEVYRYHIMGDRCPSVRYMKTKSAK